MKAVSLCCPSCNANLDIDPKMGYVYCESCGTKAFLDDGRIRFEITNNINIERVDRRIDEARIKESDTREKIEYARLDFKRERREKRNNFFLTVLSTIALLSVFLIIIGVVLPSIKSNAPLQLDEVKMPTGYTNYWFEYYEGVVSSMKALGFEDIEAFPMYDITDDNDSSLNKVESISIAGNPNFSKDDIFKKTDKVVITYHSLKSDSNSG